VAERLEHSPLMLIWFKTCARSFKKNLFTKQGTGTWLSSELGVGEGSEEEERHSNSVTPLPVHLDF